MGSKVLMTAVVLSLIFVMGNGRKLKEEAAVAQPENFMSGGGITGGLVPTPGGGLGFGLGPSVFCSFPGTGCVPIQPTIPGVPVMPSINSFSPPFGAGGAGTGAGGSGTKSPPLPLP